jgi:methionyl aminopeptidase
LNIAINNGLSVQSVAASVNEVICHGIPDSRPLEDGDIISIDVSLYLNGYHGDNCGTWCVAWAKKGPLTAL